MVETWNPMRGRPPNAPPESCWWRLEELLACDHQHAELLRARWRTLVDDGGARGYEVVWGYESLSAVSSLTQRAVRRAIRRRHLEAIHLEPGQRGPSGAQIGVALSCLLRYTRWAMGQAVR